MSTSHALRRPVSMRFRALALRRTSGRLNAGVLSLHLFSCIRRGPRIHVEAGSYAALPKNIPHGLAVRGEEARLLFTLQPAGAEYFLVPRDETDTDPARFGLMIDEPVPAG